MKRVRCNPIVRADLHEIKWLMLQLPIADRTLKGRSADQSESKPMEGAVQAFSEHRAQRWHSRYLFGGFWMSSSSGRVIRVPFRLKTTGMTSLETAAS